MARETHSDSVKIDQPGDDRETIVLVDGDLINKDWTDELAFMAEWVTIRLEPSNAENPAYTFPVSINGEGAELLVDDRVQRLRHLPVGLEMTVRRSVVEVIARSKTMRVYTDHDGELQQQIRNTARIPRRPVSQSQPFTIIHDPSPRGRAWAQEMIRREF